MRIWTTLALLAAIVGGIAFEAHAYSNCQTQCYGSGGYRSCQTSCY
jgi:hypothetical protein